MTDSILTCARVDEEDIDTRYLAGTLSEEDAEAFEEHYFSCDRCWGLVRTGEEVRAAMRDTGHRQQGATVSAPRAAPLPAGTPRVKRPSRWLSLAAAAAIVLGAGLWMQRGSESDGNALRGAGDSLQVAASARDGMLIASWTGVRGATSYRARLLASDGTLLLERETPDTSLVVALDSVPALARVGRDTAYWEVQAFNPARAVVARSAPRQAVLPPPRP